MWGGMKIYLSSELFYKQYKDSNTLQCSIISARSPKKYNFSYLKLSNKISVNKTRLLVAKFLLVPDHKPYQVFSCTSGHDWAGPLVVETQMEKEKAVAEMLAEINTHQIIPIH